MGGRVLLSRSHPLRTSSQSFRVHWEVGGLTREKGAGTRTGATVVWGGGGGLGIEQDGSFRCQSYRSYLWCSKTPRETKQERHPAFSGCSGRRVSRRRRATDSRPGPPASTLVASDGLPTALLTTRPRAKRHHGWERVATFHCDDAKRWTFEAGENAPSGTPEAPSVHPCKRCALAGMGGETNIWGGRAGLLAGAGITPWPSAVQRRRRHEGRLRPGGNVCGCVCTRQTGEEERVRAGRRGGLAELCGFLADFVRVCSVPTRFPFFS